jgi:hypothetical protein
MNRVDMILTGGAPSVLGLENLQPMGISQQLEVLAKLQALGIALRGLPEELVIAITPAGPAKPIGDGRAGEP